MPPSQPNFSRRADIDLMREWMDDPCPREVLAACLRDLARVNRWFLAYRPVLDWLEWTARKGLPQPLRILDVACGYGDTLRRVEQWAAERGLAVELTGLDLSADSILIAKEATPDGSRIRWIASDVFHYRPEVRPHLVMSSLFTHHLRNWDVVRFLRWMEDTAEHGWMINDLSRAAIPYRLFGWFAGAFRLHPFVRHDGPVSIARAFVAEDWRRLCQEAGLGKLDAAVIGYTPARLCVLREKAP